MRDGDFRVRNNEISRVEGLSDAVFGFAITLLVISLEVPKSADEVLHAMRGFFSFAITFSLLFMVWRTQFKFFRRYGLEDNKTVFLNAVLLFTVLFYVYPLKFIFTLFVDKIMWRAGWLHGPKPEAFNNGPALLLFVAYGFGWAAVFGVFSLMYRHAYSKRDELKLNPLEEFETREAIVGATSSAIMGLVIALLDFASYERPANGETISYIAIAIVLLLMVRVIRMRRGRSKRREAILGAATQNAIVT